MRAPGQESFEELRLALVLNGGVSLAVWIGGVVQEANRFVRAEGAYGELCRLTQVIPKIDVISGSSAGGLNGALLATAMAYGQPLDSLRELWVEKASLAQLLRDPLDPEPQSLLDGDGYFLGLLTETLRGLQRGRIRDKSEVPIDLTITTTLLRGQDRTLIDDFGNPVTDFTHKGTFHFVRSARRDQDPFEGADGVARLAFAARATASFPGAFEAAFCPIGSGPGASAPAFGIDMQPVADFDSDRFVVDGGVLDNKPILPAMQAIFQQPPNGDVRRVLAYVVPQPEELPKIKPGRGDDPEKRPTLAKVVTDSLVNLPRIESIASNIDELREHNEAIRRVSRTRVLLTSCLPAAEIIRLASTLYPIYRQRRVDAAIAYLTSELSRQLVKEDKRGLGQRGRREWLKRLLTATAAKQPWLPAEIEDLDKAVITDAEPAHWRWGVRPVEEAAHITFDLLKRTQRLLRGQGQPSEELEALWTDAIQLLDAIGKVRDIEKDSWHREATALGVELGQGTGDKDAADLRAQVSIWADAVLDRWMTSEVQLAKPRGTVSSARRALGELMIALSQLLVRLEPISRAAIGTANAQHDEKFVESAQELKAHLDYFVPALDFVSVRKRLLIFEVLSRAMGSQGEEHEQIVDFIQVSAEGATVFGGEAKIENKLAGTQLAHFGGFYKRSWRANDWMFGRLDMTRRLAQVLLDPERLRLVFPNRAAALDEIEKVAQVNVDSEVGHFLRRRWQLDRVLRELSYLDDPTAPVPEVLPACIDAVCARLQLEILGTELHSVYLACVQDSDGGAAQRSRGASFVSTYRASVPAAQTCAVLSPDRIVDLFLACHVGGERIEAEVGSDLFLEFTTQSLAVAIAAGQGSASGLGPLRGVLKAMRSPALGAHFFARALTMRSRTTAGLLGMAFAFTVLVLALSAATKTLDHWPWLKSAGVSVGIGLALVVAIRTPRWLGFALALAVWAAAFLLGRGVWTLPRGTLEGWRAVAITAVLLLVLPVGARISAALRGRLRRLASRLRPGT